MFNGAISFSTVTDELREIGGKVKEYYGMQRKIFIGILCTKKHAYFIYYIDDNNDDA